MKKWMALIIPVLLTASCAKYIMPTQDAKRLFGLPLSESPRLYGLKNKKIAIELVSDRTIQPMGAYADQLSPAFAIQQVYAMSEPGYVFFEKLGEVMEAEGATVYRVYTPGAEIPSELTPMLITIKAFEVHRQIPQPGDKTNFYARMIFDCEYGAAVFRDREIISVVPGYTDVFASLAKEFAAVVNQNREF